MRYFWTIFMLSIFIFTLNCKGERRKVNIDELISELLTSNKFNELAEAIANKAVEKIIKIKEVPKSAHTGKDNANFRTKNNQGGERDNRSHTNISSASLRDSEITTKTFTSRTKPTWWQHVYSTDNLSLKYKNLVTSEDNLKNKNLKESNSETKKPNILIDTEIVKVQSNENDSRGTTSEEHRTNVEEHDNNEINMSSSENSTINDVEDKNSMEGDSMVIFPAKDSHKAENETIDNNPKSIFVKKESSGNSEPPPNSQGDNNSKNDEQPEMIKSEESPAPDAADSENSKKLRRENGKIYTYKESPDYAEYHERLAIETVNTKGPF